MIEYYDNKVKAKVYYDGSSNNPIGIRIYEGGSLDFMDIETALFIKENIEKAINERKK